MAEVRLVRSMPWNGLQSVIDGFIGPYLQHPFETFLVLPNAAIRDEVKLSLVERGVPVFGACVCTLDEFARYLFDALVQDQLLADPYVLELAMYKVLEGSQERLPAIKGALGSVRTIVPELLAFIEALKDFQVDYPRCLGDLRSERSDQLALIRDLFDDLLTANHLVDRGLMLERVVSKLPGNSEVRIGRVVFYGLYEPKPIEKAVIRTVIEVAEEAEYYLPYVEGNKAFLDDGSWLNSGGGADTDEVACERHSLLFSEGPREHLDGIVKGVFRDPLDEMRSVARQIRSLIRSGVEPKKIAILMPVRSKSAPIVREVLDDHGIPFCLHYETPLAASPLIMSIFSILEAVRSNYDWDAILRLIGSPYFTLVSEEGPNALSVSRQEVEEVSLEAGIKGGKGSWSSALRSLISRTRCVMDGAEVEVPSITSSRAERAIRVEKVVSYLLSELSALEGDLTVQERANALRKVLQRFRLMSNIEVNDEVVREREARALRSFLRLLDTMEMAEALVPSGRTDLSEFVDRLRMLTAVEGFREAPENRNAVQVSGLRASYLKRFDHVFIIGMVDGDIPFLSAGNVFLREREVACMGLMGAQEQLRHERFYFLSALMSSNVRTYISRAGSNGRDTLVPSYFFDELEAAFDLDTFGGGTEESSTLCCHRLIGEMISKKRDVAEVRTALAMPLEDICRRIAVECDERDGDCTSTHEGVFADAAIISELNSMLARREAISVSRLESYARCPFTCYLESVMRIEPRPEAEEEFSSADRGVLFHRIVRRFYSELRQNGSTRFTGSQLDEMTARIMSIGREELERYGLDGPPWQAFRATLLGSGSRKGLLRAFLEKEAARGSSFEPKFFELSFGLPLDGGSDASSIDRPVAIDLGGESMMLHGRIDRVDMLPDGKFVVIDYKTGSSTPTVSNIEQGTALQLPLYIQAIETMMPGTKGIGGAYYIVRSEAEIEHKCVFGDKGHVAELKPYFGERRHYREDFRDIVHGSNDHVRSYLEGMRAGRFHPNIGPAKCPRNCSYRTICRNDGNRDGGDDAAD